MKRIFAILLGLIISFGLSAQNLSPEVTASAGEVYTNSNGSISFTIGEAIVETISDGNNTLTQGFQQARYNLSTIEENNGSDILIQLFPNPVVSGFNIVQNNNNLLLKVFNIKGQLVISNKLTTPSVFINMSSFSAGTYLVHLYNDEQDRVGLYKIQKLISQ